ncbi:hypothetical protein OIO90_003102 [Microbotryomycetes sp. JL221]|nr:hypothetical protein OIO90_003102 [Microbotryomycetes sp. JL221]
MVQPNSALENAFGTLGAVLWSVQLIPQIWKSWRRGSSEGLSTSMMLIWYISGIFLGAYIVAQDLSIALQIQPQIFTLSSAIATAQGIHYDYGRSKLVAWTFLIIATTLAGGLETGLVFAARADGSNRARQAWGVLAAITIIGGLLPQYWEVYKFKAVVGISFVFLAVDLLGGVFSLLSITYAPGSFDVLASISYSSVVALELGIFALVPLINPRYHRRQRQLAKAEQADDDKVHRQESRDAEEAGRVSLAARRSSQEEESVGSTSDQTR